MWKAVKLRARFTSTFTTHSTLCKLTMRVMATMWTVTVKNTSPEANVTIQLPIKTEELIKAVQKGAKRKSPGPD